MVDPVEAGKAVPPCATDPKNAESDPACPESAYVQYLNEGLKGVALRAALRKRYGAKYMVIKPSRNKSVWILLHPVNNRQALSTKDDFGAVWLDQGYDRTLAPAFEVAADPKDPDSFWSFAGAKRAQTYDHVWILVCHSQRVPLGGVSRFHLYSFLWTLDMRS